MSGSLYRMCSKHKVSMQVYYANPHAHLVLAMKYMKRYNLLRKH